MFGIYCVGVIFICHKLSRSFIICNLYGVVVITAIYLSLHYGYFNIVKYLVYAIIVFVVYSYYIRCGIGPVMMMIVVM